MKALGIVILGLAIMVGSLVPYNVYAAEPSESAADHLAAAKSYEDKAAALDPVIAEHEQMKKDYRSKASIAKLPITDVRKMNEHCDAIIKDAKKLKAAYLEFAKWHQMKAKELQGK